MHATEDGKDVRLPTSYLNSHRICGGIVHGNSMQGAALHKRTPSVTPPSPAGGSQALGNRVPVTTNDVSQSSQDVCKGPYTGPIQGCTWNCRSMWSKRRSNTFTFAMKLAKMHDFIIFMETRETKTRRQYTLDSLSRDYVYFSSGISARKGGVAIIVKRFFLNNFQSHKWVVGSCGRVASLCLDGKNGKLIIAVYLDPASVQEQLHGISCIKNLLDSTAHNLVAGDWNFVEHCADRIAKETAKTAAVQERRPTVEWQKLAQEAGCQEFEQAQFTCENSHGWSRIDRIYTDMHKADLMNSMSYCSTLEHPRNLSDHSPVAFSFKKRVKTPGFYLPAWVATHINFESEAAEALEHLK